MGAISEGFLPLNFATESGVLCPSKPFMVALATFKCVGEPKDLARISFIPATCKTSLAAQPAIIPVPGDAGLRRTLEDPCSPVMV